MTHSREMKLDRRDTIVITVLLISAFVVMLNETIMGVAIPVLMTEFGVSANTGQWLSTAFMLTLATLIPITGLLLVRMKTRTLYLTAMVLFIAGTTLAAASPTFAVLLIARVVQASGTAIMMPLLMTTVMELVPPQIRGKIMGRIAIVMSVAPALGPTISGIILDLLNWRWMFIIVLPIAVVAVLIGMKLMQNVTETRQVPIDPISVVLALFAFGGLVYGLSGFGDLARGEALIHPLIPLSVGIVALVLFIWRQLVLQRTDRALLDLRTFTYPVFALSNILFLVIMMSMFGMIILLPIIAQNVMLLDPLQTGLIMLPGGLIMGLMGPLVGRAYDRFGPKPIMVPGSIFLVIALWSMVFLRAETPIAYVVVAHITMSIGLSLMMTPLFTMSLGSLPKRLYAYGSATISTVQQVAGAAGTALFVMVMTLVSQRAAADGAGEILSQQTGSQWAFALGGIIATVAMFIVWFMKVPGPAEAIAEDVTPES